MTQQWTKRQLDGNGLSMRLVEQGGDSAVLLCHEFLELLPTP
ncbi:MAG TPA: hypothetical protein VNN62_11635 [Methylomirabilota bacterium]|jgi:hypothetical protein|nr:hypothetical protein [Methylomirabilota bacterium]